MSTSIVELSAPLDPPYVAPPAAQVQSRTLVGRQEVESYADIYAFLASQLRLEVMSTSRMRTPVCPPSSTRGAR